MDNYDELRKENEMFMKEFDKWLTKKDLRDKIIRNHLNNVDTFLNYYDFIRTEDSISEVGSYLSDFFIRKCMCSTAYTMKQTGVSIKKFYQCMNVSLGDVKVLLDMLKEEMDFYIDRVSEYNNYDEKDDDYSIWNYI